MAILAGCAQLPNAVDTHSTSSSAMSLGDSSDLSNSVDYSILPAMGGVTTANGHPASWAHDGNLWHYIAAQFTLPIPDNPRVQAQLNFYASHIDYLQRVTERAQPYLHMIVSDLQKNNLPLELALLPIVESAYRPDAVSSSNAAGIWQFVPSTGTHFGLARTTWYDGRRDIKASTDAAMSYFTRLRTMFNDDWPVIIASYNGGEGTLQNAIAYNAARGRPTDFWDLTQISRETADYPARLYALVEIFSHPKKYGFTPYPIPNAPVLTEIKLDKSINLGKLAQITGISHDELYRLNPGFDRLITGPQTGHLLVPKSIADQFTPKALEEAEKSARDWGRYTLRRGDSFHKVAYRFGCDVDELIKVNRLSSTYAHPGETIIVPLDRKSHLAGVHDRLYTVRDGDSLWGLSRKFNVDVADIQHMNGLKKDSVIRPGEKLIVGFERDVPAAAAHRDHEKVSKVATSAVRQKHRYTVKKGDTLWNVAQRFSTTVHELLSVNGLKSSEPLQPGQVLVIASTN
ncbi:LysM peptidoglycan-binding domain-containing protein [Halothiobacillus diazotrophicus]|nr:LysM peptidoglycan-binding domain-containing protein [Halothiobacillus diazotrophicus]